MNTRAVELPGAHARGHNTASIGVCYEGGLDARGRAKDTRTAAQKESLTTLLHELQRDYPGSVVCGHRDLSPDLNGNGRIEPHERLKECPSYSVNDEL